MQRGLFPVIGVNDHAKVLSTVTGRLNAGWPKNRHSKRFSIAVSFLFEFPRLWIAQAWIIVAQIARLWAATAEEWLQLFVFKFADESPRASCALINPCGYHGSLGLWRAGIRLSRPSMLAARSLRRRLPRTPAQRAVGPRRRALGF